MEKIIKELEAEKESELHQIGMTPHTDFKGTQTEHDQLHANNACEYQEAIDVLKAVHYTQTRIKYYDKHEK